MWKIRNILERDRYWSNDVGWTWKDFSDTFTEEEHNRVDLPMGGEWEEVNPW